MIKKKLLIVSYKIPYPLNQGGAIAQFYFLKRLAKIFDVYMCTIVANKNQELQCNRLKNIFPEITFKIFKETNYYSKKSFFERLIKVLNKINLKVSLVLGTNKVVEKSNILDDRIQFSSEEFITFFNTLIEDVNFELIQLEFFETLVLLPNIPKGIKKIVVHHELRSKRNSLINTENLTYKNYVSKVMERLENSLLNLSDRIVVFNEEDKYYLNGVKTNIIVSPFGIPEELVINHEVSSFFNRFIFLGSEFHFPNKEGLEWFLNSIYIPNDNNIEWPIFITGYWSDIFKRKYKLNKKIIFTGYLQNFEEIFKNSVMVAPIISGSGVRTKILEALANKIPVISTPFASEGLFSKTSEIRHLLHFSTREEFQELNNIIIKDADYLTRVAQSGFNYYNNNFDKDVLFNKRLKAYLE
jgi:glycosyltransferase involved in cell wall biosynthesis